MSAAGLEMERTLCGFNIAPAESCDLLSPGGTDSRAITSSLVNIFVLLEKYRHPYLGHDGGNSPWIMQSVLLAHDSLTVTCNLSHSTFRSLMVIIMFLFMEC